MVEFTFEGTPFTASVVVVKLVSVWVEYVWVGCRRDSAVRIHGWSAMRKIFAQAVQMRWIDRLHVLTTVAVAIRSTNSQN